MNCPECNKEMRWVGDESPVGEDYMETVYDCSKCEIDVIKRTKIIKF